jgi:hypothetical protein
MKALNTCSAIAMSLLAACAQKIEMTTPFDPNEVDYINRGGAGPITGQAFMRQIGGGVVTCAGAYVDLIPAGRYARERMFNIYRSEQGGRISVRQSVDTNNVDPRYLQIEKETRCDAEGDFEFTDVANGD